MTLRAGRLRHTVDILAETRVKESSGWHSSWDAIANGTDVPAEVLFLGGREAMLDQSFKGIRTYKITMRWRGDVTEDMQLRYDSKILDITAADDPDGRREALLILAQTGTSVPVP